MTRWQIFSAVALRKLPELKPRRDLIEARVQDIFDKYEVASSKFSLHEQQHIEDTKPKDEDSEISIKETAQDKLDRWMKERSSLNIGQYNERLTKTQYLFIKSKFGTDIKDQWLLPQAIYDSKLDQNLLDTARRALKESLDIVNGFRIVSKVPSSVLKVPYPKKIVESTGYEGAKVFYLKAHIDQPSPSVLKAVESNSENKDKLIWLTMDEALKVVDSKYIRGLFKGTLREDRVDTDRVLAIAAKYAQKLRAKQEKLLSQRQSAI